MPKKIQRGGKMEQGVSDGETRHLFCLFSSWDVYVFYTHYPCIQGIDGEGREGKKEEEERREER